MTADRRADERHRRVRQALHRDFDEAFYDSSTVGGVDVVPIREPVRGDWSTVPDAEATIVFLHGGSYNAYDPSDPWYRAFCARLALRCRARVFAVAYRLAPAHPFPAALDDATRGLAYASERYDVPTFACGDSAGAGLAVAAALRATERGGAPVGVISISGLFDLTASSDSYDSRRWTGRDGDPLFCGTPADERRSTIRDGLVYLGVVDGDGDAHEADVARVLRASAPPRPLRHRGALAAFKAAVLSCVAKSAGRPVEASVADDDLCARLRHPLVSPLFAASFKDLPPLLLMAGTNEVLLDDSTRLAARAAADGADVTLEVFPHMWHDWVLYLEGNAIPTDAVPRPFALPEAVHCLDTIAAWTRRVRRARPDPP